MRNFLIVLLLLVGCQETSLQYKIGDDIIIHEESWGYAGNYYVEGKLENTGNNCLKINGKWYNLKLYKVIKVKHEN